MNAKEVLEILSVAERLKDTTRHCFTSKGRRESVAEHCWRISLMAMLLGHEDEFRDLDINKVIRMCLIHDLGEAFTGDIPAFLKTDQDTEAEDDVLYKWMLTLPDGVRDEFLTLTEEMDAQETREAKLYKALDKVEALIQHNESDIATWLPLEYELQLTYGKEEMEFSPYMKVLRVEIDRWTKEKIEKGTSETGI